MLTLNIPGNGSLLVVVGCAEHLHTKHFLILTINMINDIILNLAYIPWAIALLLMENDNFSYSFFMSMKWSAALTSMFVNVQISMTGLLSMER